MNLERATLRKLIAGCDPQAPLEGGDPRYIPFDAEPSVRGERACIDVLRRTILNTDGGSSCQLFTGFPGTGKTTELKRLADRLTSSPPPDAAHVLFIDFEDYIQKFYPISITDVLRVIAYCFACEADRIEKSVDETRQGEAFLRALFKSVRETLPTGARLKPEFEVYGVKLMLELRNNKTIHDEIELAIKARFQHFVEQCMQSIQDSLERIRRKLGSKADRIIVIADGLEKLDALHEDDRQRVEDAVESLFIAHSEFLRLPCHVIYTFPVWLRFRTAQLGAVYACEPLTLPMVKTHERDGTPFANGLDKLHQLMAHRLGPLERIFGADPRPALRPILEASGGYPRDALRMVRALLQSEETFPVTAAQIERTIRGVRQTYHDIVLGTHAPLLKEIADNHRVPTGDGERLRQFGQLFSRFLVLAYRNGEEWFDLHPLVRKAPGLIDALGDDAP